VKTHSKLRLQVEVLLWAEPVGQLYELRSWLRRSGGENSATSGNPFGPKVLPMYPGRTLESLERAMGIEIIATWFFKDLRSRARTDLEGLGTLRNPYCRLDAALLPQIFLTTLRFASRTALGTACV